MQRLKQAPWEHQEVQEGFLQEVMAVLRQREVPRGRNSRPEESSLQRTLIVLTEKVEEAEARGSEEP